MSGTAETDLEAAEDMGEDVGEDDSPVMRG